MTRKIKVEIIGKEPGLLMNRFDIETYGKTSRKATKQYIPKEEAERSAYWTGDGKKKELCIPSICIYAAILRASSFYKIKKRSAKSYLAGNLKISPFEIGLGTDKYNIDTRSAVIQRARILVSRALLKKWKATFTIELLDDAIEPGIVREILGEAGKRMGLMSYSPRSSGPFGCFSITKWKEL